MTKPALEILVEAIEDFDSYGGTPSDDTKISIIDDENCEWEITHADDSSKFITLGTLRDIVKEYRSND